MNTLKNKITVHDLIMNDKLDIRQILVRLFVKFYSKKDQRKKTAVFTAQMIPCELGSPLNHVTDAQKHILEFSRYDVISYRWDDKNAVLEIQIKDNSDWCDVGF